jgi:hypothetical protein
MGGLIEVVFILSSKLIGSFSEFQFFIKAIQKLFLAKTKDDKLFQKSRNRKM